MVIEVTRHNYRQIYRAMRVDSLALVAEACTSLSHEDDNRSQFSRLVVFCKQMSILDDNTLAAFAGVDKSSANRWLHGKGSPRNAVLRRAVLESIAEEALSRMERLQRGEDELLRA